ncbi:MAG: serine/threonine protein phosphatase [Bradymonadales bacterium]|nr:serine/threonine protein phosphatase [Bradymonadales bacterium]
MIVFDEDQSVADQQMYAIIFYLVTFGYIDGEFDATERAYSKEYIRRLVEWRADGLGLEDQKNRRYYVEKSYQHFLEVFAGIDQWVSDLFLEAVSKDEDINQFVLSKLKLKCFEHFVGFNENTQRQLMKDADELIAADGIVHPSEVQFREELLALLKAENPLPEQEFLPVSEQRFNLQKPVKVIIRIDNHPLFPPLETHYSRDTALLMQQATEDVRLIRRAIGQWAQQGVQAKGRLAGRKKLADLDGEQPFLDQHVYCLPIKPGERYELIVLGDLHGCYSCLKGALMQSEFVKKVEAYNADPIRNHPVKLVFLGDYIDRGIYSYNGVLRAVLQIFTKWPKHVYVLRGNHEYYLERQGKVMSGVAPAEAIATMAPYLPSDHFKAYRELFEAMPNLLLFGRTVFVHAGIPRDDVIDSKWVDLSSLNDPLIRFQMLWSDPSEAKYVPADLQKANARFPFGSLQFRRFMGMIGANTMIRGHEKIDSGFTEVYDDGAVSLYTLFSAGGATNSDLPEKSSYRKVTPKALTILYQDGIQKATPWTIDWERYQFGDRNGFYRSPPEIEFRQG